MDGVSSVQRLENYLPQDKCELVYVEDPVVTPFPDGVKLYKGDTIVIEVGRASDYFLFRVSLDWITLPLLLSNPFLIRRKRQGGVTEYQVYAFNLICIFSFVNVGDALEWGFWWDGCYSSDRKPEM